MKKNYFKKILNITMILIMILTMSIDAFAIGDINASYTQVPLANSPKVSGQFTVYLSISSNRVNGEYIRRFNLPVTMGTANSNRTYFVSDVMTAAQNQYVWLTVQGLNNNYINGIKDATIGNTVFGPVAGYDNFNGWMFRINDKYPLLNQNDWPSGWTSTMGPCGAAINQAYVTEDQKIDFYHADTMNINRATHSFKSDSFNYSGGTLNTKLYTSYSYFDMNNNYKWVIKKYSLVKRKSFQVRIDGNINKSITCDSSGNAKVTGLSLSSGTHTIEILPQFVTFGIYGIPKYSGAKFSFTV